MVDVIVDGITTLELVVYATGAEHHGLRHVVLVENHNAVFVAGNRCIGAADALHLFGRVVTVLIDTLVAESVDATQGSVQLYTGQVRAVLAVELFVEAGQTGLFHRSNLVLVVSKRDVEVGRELADLDDAVTVQVELPTDVLHVTDVLIGQR